MPKKTQTIEIEKISGNQYKSFEEAREAALPIMIENLTAIIQRLLEEEILKTENGNIVPNYEKIKKFVDRETE